MNYKYPLLFLLVGISITFSSCFLYSFKGTSIPAEVNTYFVERFDVRANSAIPTLGQTLSEALKDKIRAESNLKQSEIEPHIEFKGVVTDYYVSSEAPQAGETTAFNRLSITLSVEYIYHQDEEKNWKENFRTFSDFGSNVNLIDVQDQLIDAIQEEMIEKIFNKAFNDW
jgi:hypothetical protein